MQNLGQLSVQINSYAVFRRIQPSNPNAEPNNQTVAGMGTADCKANPW
jgi:hypothetical protein